MKNLFLLPTNKPTRLHIDLIDNSLFLFSNSLNLSHKPTGKHIYITNSEEIKEGDYIGYPTLNNWIPVKYLGGDLIGTEKKIILTTDPDLITDGVQAIDDEFLEWFLTNPSCEYVKVDKIPDLQSYSEKTHKCELVYTIIIPQEEPKQEQLEEAAQFKKK
jgi:hypothetical protein